jgi:hypothetical protein
MPKMKLPNPFEYDIITLRGIIIATTINVEQQMNEFLGCHFCSSTKRKNELCELLFLTERSNFEYKKQITIAILNKHYKPFKFHNKKFVQYLSDISPYRNIFAHLELELDKCEGITTPLGTEVSKIAFKRYHMGEYKPAIYSITEINGLSEKMQYLIDGFKKLIIEMPPTV